MSQVLDTQVSGGGSFYLDNQSEDSLTGLVINGIIGDAIADGVLAVANYARIIQTTTGNATGNGVTATLSNGVIISAIVASAQAAGTTASLSYGITINATVAAATANGITATLSGTTYADYFAIKLRHKTTGAPLTGLTTVALTLFQPSTGYRLDFSDGVFKDSPTTSSAIMSELNSSTHPGVYRLMVNVSGWEGWANWESTYNDGSFIYSQSGERYYISSVRSDGIPSSTTDIATAVWDHPVDQAVTPSTMGVWLYTRVLTVGKYLGLS